MISSMIYMISRFMLKVFLKIFLKLKATGQHNLPRKGPYIVACNHVSYLDPPILGGSITPKARFLVQDTLFKKGLMGWWMRNNGCIPVKRGERDLKAMKRTLKFLGKGGVLAIFPEGTRSEDDSLKKAHAGMGFLAFKAQVPIIPAYIKGSIKALRKHSKSLTIHPVHIYFGPKIEPRSFSKREIPKERYEEIGKLVMSEIAKLKAKHGD